MNKFDFMALDFRSLHTLKLVHDLGSFSRAAERLGQNQSTISYAVGRLRAVFDDPLFVRQGRSIAPTPRCVDIVAGVERLFDQLAALAEPRIFDPALSDVEIVLSCNHYERAVLLPRIVRRLRVEAPRMRLKVINAQMLGHDQLRQGECDLLLSPVLSEAPGLYRRLLIEDRYVCVLDADHPLAHRAMSIEDFARADHVFISYEGAWRPSYRDTIEAHGVSPHMVIDLPSSGEVGRLLRGTDLIATVSNLLARSFEPGLAIRRGPFDSRLRVYQYWSARTHPSPAHQWFRSLLAEEANVVTRASTLPEI